MINVAGYLNINPPDDVSIALSNTVNDTRHTEVLAFGFNFTTALNVTALADTAYNKIIFKAPSVGNDALFITSITAEPMCVLAGTRFLRADGSAVVVEALQPGDRIRTADGMTAVEWVGQQAIDTRLTHPGRVNPVCIRKGALADGLSARDIYIVRRLCHRDRRDSGQRRRVVQWGPALSASPKCRARASHTTTSKPTRMNCC